MQPCFILEKQVKASVNLLSILTVDLSFEQKDIKTSWKCPCTPDVGDSFSKFFIFIYRVPP